MRVVVVSLASMHAAKGTPERNAYEQGRTDLSIKFHNRMQLASEFLDQFVKFLSLILLPPGKTFVIDCSDFGCDCFFEELWWLGALVSLNFSHNVICSIPSDISMLQNLTIVKLNHNQLVTIPVEVCVMTRLQRLFLHNNCLDHLPSQICQLSGLLTLTIDENPIQKLPFRFGYLPLRSGYDIGFQIFKCDSSKFIEPPEQVMCQGSDRAIQFLKVFAEVEDGSESFSLREWNLLDWPLSFGLSFMHHVAVLDVAHNNFSNFHPSILLNMNRLVTLDLSFNRVSEIPLTITNLTNMQNLFLQGNPITVLPVAVAYIKCLQQYSIGICIHIFKALIRL